MTELLELRARAESIFTRALAATRPSALVARALQLDGSRLRVANEAIDLDAVDAVVVIAFGKAALGMARAADAVLGPRIVGGVVATAMLEDELPERWKTFAAGHPLPNAASLQAGAGALELLAEHDGPRTLALFLVSGGGSAMLECPSRRGWTLDDLVAANRELVGCGAVIEEINAVRRCWSSIKGGRLAAAAPLARKVSLYVSDVNAGDIKTIASGPTWLHGSDDAAGPSALEVVRRYRLKDRLPAGLVAALRDPAPPPGELPGPSAHAVLLDNDGLLEVAAGLARDDGFAVAIAADLVEVEVETLAGELLRRADSMQREHPRAGVCLLAGGEAICPVRGGGRGGRNQELALRVALGLERRGKKDIVFLSAGTDGIDGNSPAAGAVCDGSTIARSRRAGLDACAALADSDSYGFFAALGDMIVTGPTDHNVRDLRILLGSGGVD